MLLNHHVHFPANGCKPLSFQEADGSHRAWRHPSKTSCLTQTVISACHIQTGNSLLAGRSLNFFFTQPLCFKCSAAGHFCSTNSKLSKISKPFLSSLKYPWYQAVNWFYKHQMFCTVSFRIHPGTCVSSELSKINSRQILWLLWIISRFSQETTTHLDSSWLGFR